MALPPDNAGKQFLHAGSIHHRAGRLDEAKELYLRELASDPDNAVALHLLGVVLHQQGDPSRAIALIRKAVTTKPDYPEAYSALATALKITGKIDEAAACLRQAIALNPNVADWHSNLAVALMTLGNTEEAAAACRRAIAIRPDHAVAHNVLGNALTTLGKVDEAADAYSRAIVIRPDYADAHGSLGILLLAMGELRQGFQEYRWRWQASNFLERMPVLACPLWQGESLSGKAILVYCEQGYGDSIQFIRYAAPLSRMAARVTVHTNEPLAGLFRSIPGIEVVTAYEDCFDYHIPLMCLPRLFKTTLETIPAEVPYLAAEPRKAARWAERLSVYEDKTKAGLVWAGGAHARNVDSDLIDRLRSVTLQQFAPLADIAGIQFFSLQKGEPAAQALHPPPGMQLIDMTAELHDFEETTALVGNLDLVITVDTSVAHLAGALGKPVWILSRFNGCWRWLRGREDSPWYPTARLFHQKTAGAWDEVVARVAAELAKLSKRRALSG
jgi:tetratricopeptide (TPR) repeat protein